MSLIKSAKQNRHWRRIQTVLDIGTSKSSCMMAEISPQAEGSIDAAPGYSIEILAAAHQRSQGIKAGVVADLDGVETTLRSVVGQVEKLSGLEITDLILSVSCGRLRSNNFRASTPLEGKTVTSQDIQRLIHAGRSFAERDGRLLVHTNLIGYRLDNEVGIDQPIGMAGQKISQELHMVSADPAPLKNLLLTAERSYFNVEGLIPSAYASAEAVLSSEEKKLGVISIDLGGGTSSFAVFADGHFIHMDGITLGGDHITYDIARALSTALHEAERIKTLYGTVINASSDECEMVSYRKLSDRGNVVHNISKAALRRIIRPRVEEILSLIKGRLAACQLSCYAGDRVVLTGGASQLQGIVEFSAYYLGCSVRMGTPLTPVNLPVGMDGPAFSSPIGQLMLAPREGQELSAGLYAGGQNRAKGYFSQVGNWLRESF